MFRNCGVSWYGAGKKAQIEIGKDLKKFFSEDQREITIFINHKKYYSTLPDSFFSSCKHLRTAYDQPSVKGINRLHEWVIQHSVSKARLEILMEHKEYRLSKIE